MAPVPGIFWYVPKNFGAELFTYTKCLVRWYGPSRTKPPWPMTLHSVEFDSALAMARSNTQLSKPQCAGLEERTRLTYKYVSFSLLIVQNTALVFTLQHAYRERARSFSTLVVTFLTETLKLVFCVAVLKFRGKSDFAAVVRYAVENIQLAVPAALYTAQTQLLFQGAKCLPPSVFVALSQTKIITTAIFSALLLNTKIFLRQKVSLLLLASGMIAVGHASASNDGQRWDEQENKRLVFRGVLAVVLASVTSGFAGCYLEKIFKENGCIWTRNMQLCFFSLPVTLLAILLCDGSLSSHTALFDGIDRVVCAVVILQAVGGLVVSGVMKFASSILKCYAVSISICLCASISMVYGNEKFDSTKFLGVLTVATAAVIYSS